MRPRGPGRAEARPYNGWRGELAATMANRAKIEATLGGWENSDTREPGPGGQLPSEACPLVQVYWGNRAKRTSPGHLLAAEDSQERGEVCVCAELLHGHLHGH
jgi:hypothetical protein